MHDNKAKLVFHFAHKLLNISSLSICLTLRYWAGVENEAEETLEQGHRAALQVQAHNHHGQNSADTNAEGQSDAWMI
jgi:hypothetical protein